MNPEHMLVPFEVSPLPEGPWLVFAPHADDETFGMGGGLLRAAAAEIATHVVVITDGARGGDAPDLVNIRRREVQAATDRLGVKGLQLWDEPDRGLAITEPLVQRIIKTILEIQPASVFFPAPLELHPDHRAAAQLVWRALGDLATQGNACPDAYGYEISVQSPINLLLDISAQAATKRDIMESYASQVSQIDYPGLVAALNRARALTLPPDITSAEGYFHYRKPDFTLSLSTVTTHYIGRYFT